MEIDKKIYEQIQTELDEIERKESVRIIYAAESGSRAWGFASPDSDYDVRFVYVRNISDYLRLDDVRDVIEWKLDDTLDISGWDIKKTLELTHASNISAFEWAASPITYRTSDEWENFKAVMHDFYDPKAAAYHYYALGIKAYKTYLCGETVKLKKYFYSLRSIVSCEWILENMTPPPIFFDELKDRYMRGDVLKAVNELIKAKVAAVERDETKPIPILQEYIVKSLENIKERIDKSPARKYVDWSMFNKYFCSLLGVPIV